VAKIVLTSSIGMQSLVEIDKRTATGERKNKKFFVCHAPAVGVARCRGAVVHVGVSSPFITDFHAVFLRFLRA